MIIRSIKEKSPVYTTSYYKEKVKADPWGAAFPAKWSKGSELTSILHNWVTIGQYGLLERELLKLAFGRSSGIPDEYMEQFIILCSSAEHIKSLSVNWDDEGSLGYKEETVETAKTFLLSFVQKVYESYNIRLPMPRILPGPDSSIDIHWKEDSFELLLNIPADSEYAEFYGDNVSGEVVKGRINMKLPHPNVGLIMWLENIR